MGGSRGRSKAAEEQRSGGGEEAARGKEAEGRELKEARGRSWGGVSPAQLHGFRKDGDPPRKIKVFLEVREVGEDARHVDWLGKLDSEKHPIIKGYGSRCFSNP